MDTISDARLRTRKFSCFVFDVWVVVISFTVEHYINIFLGIQTLELESRWFSMETHYIHQGWLLATIMTLCHICLGSVRSGIGCYIMINVTDGLRRLTTMLQWFKLCAAAQIVPDGSLHRHSTSVCCQLLSIIRPISNPDCVSWFGIHRDVGIQK